MKGPSLETRGLPISYFGSIPPFLILREEKVLILYLRGTTTPVGGTGTGTGAGAVKTHSKHQFKKTILKHCSVLLYTVGLAL